MVVVLLSGRVHSNVGDGRVQLRAIDVRSSDKEILNRLEDHHQIFASGRLARVGSLGPLFRQEANRHFDGLIGFETDAALVEERDAVAAQDDVRGADGRAGTAIGHPVLDLTAVRKELVATVGWRKVEVGHFAPRVEIAAQGLHSVVGVGRAEVGPIGGAGSAGIARRKETTDAIRA